MSNQLSKQNKNFNQSLENKMQHLGNGLKSLGESLVKCQENKKKWDDESRLLGLISTKDKIAWLEAEIYRCIDRKDEDPAKLLAIFEILLKSQKQQEIISKRKANERADLIAGLSSIIVYVAIAFFLGTMCIVPTYNKCLKSHSNSNYCVLVREKFDFFLDK